MRRAEDVFCDKFWLVSLVWRHLEVFLFVCFGFFWFSLICVIFLCKLEPSVTTFFSLLLFVLGFTFYIPLKPPCTLPLSTSDCF